MPSRLMASMAFSVVQPSMILLPTLIVGPLSHCVGFGRGRLVGLVTQTDMIVALARLAVTGAARVGKSP